MKRKPRARERALIHSTTNTGDVKLFAICPENFKPEIVSRMREMRSKAVAGYRLAEVSKIGGAWHFYVVRDRDGVYLSENWARVNNRKDIDLATSITSVSMPPDEAYMLSDLEQCAALMLIEKEES